jgi:hypothetical protein
MNRKLLLVVVGLLGSAFVGCSKSGNSTAENAPAAASENAGQTETAPNSATSASTETLAVTAAPGEFPISYRQIMTVLGRPTNSDPEQQLLDYQGKFNVTVYPFGMLEIMMKLDAEGRSFAKKLLDSKFFTAPEREAIQKLMDGRGGKADAGRFKVDAKESIVVESMLILKIEPRDSPSGKLGATSVADPTPARTKPLNYGRTLLRTIMPGHTDAVRALAFSPDGKLLASGSAAEDRTIRLWDLSTSQSKVVLSGHNFPIWSLAFRNDGKALLS